MSDILSTNPNSLPRFNGNLDLSSPITISVAFPKEKLRFIQVIKLRFILFYFVVFIFSLYQLLVLNKENFLMVLSLSFFMMLAEIYKNYQRYKHRKGRDDPNLLTTKNLLWKAVPIITLNEKKITFSIDYFENTPNSIDYQYIENIQWFYLSGDGYSKVLVFKLNKSLITQDSQFLPSDIKLEIYNKYLIVNNKFLIEAKDLKNLILKSIHQANR